MKTDDDVYVNLPMLDDLIFGAKSAANSATTVGKSSPFTVFH
jgi:hypothetical protein